MSNEQVKRTINVTGGFIAAGSAGDCCSCPIALAIGAELAPGFTVEVTTVQVLIYRGISAVMVPAVYSMPLPVIAVHFIKELDSRFGGDKTVAPISFELTGPSSIWKTAPLTEGSAV